MDTPITAIIQGSTEQQRAITWVLIALAAAALLMATIGPYGVSATISNARSRELAIRAAIGAQRRSLLGLIVRQGLMTATLGVALGIAASVATDPWPRALRKNPAELLRAE